MDLLREFMWLWNNLSEKKTNHCKEACPWSFLLVLFCWITSKILHPFTIISLCAAWSSPLFIIPSLTEKVLCGLRSFFIVCHLYTITEFPLPVITSVHCSRRNLLAAPHQSPLEEDKLRRMLKVEVSLPIKDLDSRR